MDFTRSRRGVQGSWYVGLVACHSVRVVETPLGCLLWLWLLNPRHGLGEREGAGEGEGRERERGSGGNVDATRQLSSEH